MPQYTKPHSRNGSNSSSPQLMRGFVDPTYVYGIHVDEAANGYAFKWNLTTGTYVSISLALLASNHLNMPLFDPTDDHYSLAIGVAPNAAGTADEVFITGNHHDNLSSPTTTHLIKCSNVSAFTTVGSWAAESTAAWDSLDQETGANPGTYSYHIFERLANGTLLHFLSQSEFSNNSQGRDWLAFKYSGGAWSPLLASGGHFATTENGLSTDADRVYITGVLVDYFNNIETIHVALIWRTNDTDPTSQQSPCYIKSIDGGLSWTAADGTTQPMPITWQNRGPSVISSAPSFSSAYRLGIYVSPTTGNPAIIVRDQSTANYVRLSYNGSGWITETLVSSGGEIREFNIKASRWYRINSSGRVALRRSNNLQTIFIGGGINTAGTNFSPNPDPISLREGTFLINVGDGPAPKLYSFGNGAKMH